MFSMQMLHLSCWSEAGFSQIATQATLDVSVLADVGLHAFCLWEGEREANSLRS